MVHDESAELDAPGADAHKLHGIAPGRCATRTEYRDRDVPRDLGDRAQRLRLDRRACQTAVRRAPPQRRVGDERIDVDPHEGLDRVGGGEGVGAAAAHGACHIHDVGDMRRDLDRHGDPPRRLLHPARGQLGRRHALREHFSGVLADISLRARKAALDHVGTGALKALHERLPVFLFPRHDARTDELLRKFLLERPDGLLHPVGVMLRNEIDIPHAEEKLPVVIERGHHRVGEVDARPLDRRGLEYRTRPAHRKCPPDHVDVVGRRAGREYKRVLDPDPQQVVREVPHGTRSAAALRFDCHHLPLI